MAFVELFFDLVDPPAGEATRKTILAVDSRTWRT